MRGDTTEEQCPRIGLISGCGVENSIEKYGKKSVKFSNKFSEESKKMLIRTQLHFQL